MLLLALLFSPAQAGGYYFGDSGIVAAGRSGAWVAGADTPFAQYYNPAGLIHVDAPTFTLGLSGVQQTVRFDRVDDAGNSLPTAQNRAPQFGVPQLGFAAPINDKLGFAFGFTSPFAPSSEYDPDGAQRYSVIDTTIWQFFVGGSIAWRPKPWLTLGASVGNQSLRVDNQLAISVSGPRSDGSDDPEADVGVQLQTWDAWQPWWNVGVLIDPHEKVTIGASFTPPANFTARGSGELDFTDNFLEGQLDEAVWRDDDIALGVAMPLFLRTGVAYRPHPRTEIELAVVWEPWSTLSDLEASDIDVTVTGRFGDQQLPESISLPSDFRNSVAVKLGGEWRVDPSLEVRAGAMWERGAQRPETMSVALVDPAKVQGSFGGTVWAVKGRVRFDVFASGIYMPTRTQDASQVEMIVVPVLAGDPQPSVVGNGTVRSLGYASGISASWVLTKHARQTPQGHLRDPWTADTP